MNKAAAISAWVLQVLLGLAIAAGGALKLSGDPAMVELFDDIGAGQWLRLVVGVLEVAGGVGLLVPRVRALAALCLLVLLFGATLTNVVVLGTSPLVPLLYAAAALAIVLLRRETRRHRGRRHGREGAPEARTRSRPPATITRATRRLLACGIAAGPLFLAVALTQAFTREGFDLRRHPISLLSLGDLGWIQVANFVVAGVLYLACAVGLRRVLRPGRGGTWGPLLVGALGVGLVMGGVFVADPGAGFPPGAPAGAPEQVSWHGMLHNLGPILAFNGMIVGCLVFARRFAALGLRGWVTACVATAVAVFALTWWPDLDGISVRLVIASAILFGFVAALAARLLLGGPLGHDRQPRGGARGADQERPKEGVATPVT
jgi:uncharacterized membrane protein